MTTIVTRAGKGTPLTNTEVDTNFTNLNTDKLELGGTFSSGTANSILYLNASKVATSGSALTFDGSSLGVGISPLYRVHASNDADAFRIVGMFENPNTGTSAQSAVRVKAGTNTATMGVAGSGAASPTVYVGSDQATPLLFYTGNSYQYWQINTVETMRLTSTGLKSAIAGSNSDPVFSYTSDTNTGIFFPAADKLGFVAGGGTNDMVLTTSGLGLGTASPAYRLVLSGSEQVTGGGASTIPALATTLVSGEINGSLNDATDFGLLRLSAGGRGGNLNTKSAIDLQGFGSTDNSQIRFYTAGVERSQINSSGTLILRQSSNAANTSVSFNTTVQNALTLNSSGNLSIGTTGVSGRATVLGAGSQVVLHASGNTTSDGIADISVNRSGAADYAVGRASNIQFNNSTTGSQAILQSADGGYQFWSNPLGGGWSERARISSDGTFRVKGAGTAGSTDAVQFSGSAPASSLILDSSGNLGVGVSPANKLQANGSIVDNASGAYSQFTPTGFGALVGGYGANNTANLWLAGGVGNNTNQVGHYINSVMSGNGGGGGSASLQIGQLAWSGTAFTSGSAQVTLDSSGNLGLGVTPSAWTNNYKVLETQSGWLGGNDPNTVFFGQNNFVSSGNFVYKATAAATQYRQTAGAHQWFNAASGTAGNAITFTQAMTLDASGNLGVAETSPATYGRLAMRGASGSPPVAYLSVMSDTTVYGAGFESSAYIGHYRTDQSNNGQTVGYRLKTVATDATNASFLIEAASRATGSSSPPNVFSERVRINGGGYFKASDNGTYVNGAGTYHELNQSANDSVVKIYASNASFGSEAVDVRIARNTTGNNFYAYRYYNTGAAAAKFLVADSGDVTNTNGTYGTISDQKHKTDIVDAGSQWADIKALRFRKFKMINDPDQRVQLGVVAQEVELTSPGLVDEHADRDAAGNDLGTTTKSVKTSILLMKAAVALQEAMTRIEQLEAKVASLESKGA